MVSVLDFLASGREPHMAIALRTGTGNNGTIVEMNTTPLIDVLLVLLVMLILTIPIQSHAVKIDLPHGPPVRHTVPPDVIQLDVDFDGTVIWNGAAIRDRATLNAYFAIEGRKPVAQQAEVHVRANRLAKYGAVATILADAQRAGVRKVGFAGHEQYAE
jgi:biopolymer transport protein ExbD